jgi:hypothetical protein
MNKQTEFNKAMNEVLKNNEKKLLANLNKKELAKALALRDFIIKVMLIREEMLKAFGHKTKTEIIKELLEPVKTT